MNTAEIKPAYLSDDYFWAEGPLTNKSNVKIEQSTTSTLPMMTLDCRALINKKLDFYWMDNELFSTVPPHINIARGVVGLTNFCIQQDINSIFMLDKSARPYAYLFLKTWQSLYRDSKPPKVKFIRVSRYGSCNEPISSLSDEIISELKVRYKIQDSEKVAVIDEYVNSMKTLKKATRVLRRTFPQNNIFPAYISDKMAPWYQKQSIIGVKDIEDVSDKHFLTMPVRWRPIYSIHKNNKSPMVELRNELKDLASAISECTTPVSSIDK